MSGPLVKVLGSIAAGKTTLAQALAEDLDYRFVGERPGANPFLPRMSTDPRRWCFANQVWYLNEAVNSIPPRNNARGLVVDHSVEEVVSVHNPVFRAHDWLDDEEMALLTELGSTPPNDSTLYICLDAPPIILLGRILQRGRKEDRVPDPEYLEEVANARRAFIRTTTVPVLRIRSDEVDFRTERARKPIIAWVLRSIGS